MKVIAPIFVFALLIIGCSETKKSNNHSKELNKLRAELDSLKAEQSIDTKGKIATFLTFQKNNAEEAMNFYVDLFENSEIVSLQRWGNEGPQKEGSIMHATFYLDGKLFMCSDSPPIHDWDFTPAVSNYVACEDENEIESLFTKLSENGQVLMPIDNYGWSQKFAFVEDRFGISWQLNLP